MKKQKAKLKKFKVVVGVRLAYEVEAESLVAAQGEIFDVSLPDEYVPDTIELLEIVERKQ